MSTIAPLTPRGEWLQQRKQGVGASEAAALFGVHPYISQLSLYESKISDVIDEEGNERMEDGKVIEPRIAARYEKATGRKLFKPAAAIVWHPRIPHMFCTPDYLFTQYASIGDYVQDAETIPTELKWWDNYREGDEIPEYAVIQSQDQQDCLGASFGAVAILGSFRSFHHQDIERHQPFIDLLHEKIEEFWYHVENRIPPTADGSDATKEALKRLYPRDNGATIFLPAEATAWANDRAAAKIAEKAAKARVDFADNQLKAAIGDATFGVTEDGQRFSLKYQKRKSYTVKESEFRVLREAAE